MRTDGQAMSSFANLLKTIVRVNEERVDAIRKIANLQDYMLTKNRLKMDDYYDSIETPDTPNIDDPPKMRRMNTIPITKECNYILYNNGGWKHRPPPSPEETERCVNLQACSAGCVQMAENKKCRSTYCTKELLDQIAENCIKDCEL